MRKEFWRASRWKYSFTNRILFVQQFKNKVYLWHILLFVNLKLTILFHKFIKSLVKNVNAVLLPVFWFDDVIFFYEFI